MKSKVSKAKPAARRPSRKILHYLFFLRASFHGFLHWTCPLCGGKKRSRLHPLIWWIECGGIGNTGKYAAVVQHIPVRFVPSLGLRPMPMGAIQRPADWGVPETEQLVDAFPRGELVNDLWRQGWPTHRLVRNELERDLEAVERYMERVVKAQGMKLAPDDFIEAIHRELGRMRLTVSLWRDVDSAGSPPAGVRDKLRQLGVDVPSVRAEKRMKKGKG